MNLNKDVSSWAAVSPASVAAGSRAQVENVLQMALEDIARLGRAAASERDAREKMDDALRRKDRAMSVMFKRLDKAGVDYSDLIS